MMKCFLTQIFNRNNSSTNEIYLQKKHTRDIVDGIALLQTLFQLHLEINLRKWT